MTDNSAETELLALADDLERDALHDGHSSDWFVAHCIRVRKAAKALRSTAATVSRDREALRHIKARTYSSDRMCALPAESVAQIADIAAAALAALPVPLVVSDAKDMFGPSLGQPVPGEQSCKHSPAYDCRSGDNPCKCILSPVLVQLVQTKCEQPVLSGNDGSEAKSGSHWSRDARLSGMEPLYVKRWRTIIFVPRSIKSEISDVIASASLTEGDAA